jgi:hypothetical protein
MIRRGVRNLQAQKSSGELERNLHEWRSRISTRSTFSSNILRNARRNAPPRRTRRPLPRPLSYLLPRSPTLSPASPSPPFCLSVADHGQVRALPYTSFRWYFNPYFIYSRTPLSNQALPPPLNPLSRARIPPPPPPLAILLVPVHLSTPITLTTPITLLNALLTTRRVRTTGTCLIVQCMQDQIPVGSMTRPSPIRI